MKLHKTNNTIGKKLSPVLITVENLSFAYGRQKNTLENINLTVNKNERVCVIGPNGGGKSTLIKILAGQIKTPFYFPLSKQNIAYLPQNSNIDINFPLSVVDVMAQANVNNSSLTKADFLLELVGLQAYRKCPISQLSGGQLQKLLIARLFALDRPLYLLDEPFNAIDQGSITILLDYITQLEKVGKTIVMVLHDLELAQRHFARGICVANSIKGDGPTHEVVKSMEHST